MQPLDFNLGTPGPDSIERSTGDATTYGEAATALFLASTAMTS